MRVLHAFSIPLSLCVADRILKTIALHTPHLSWGGIFVFHRNTGIAFSIMLPETVMVLGITLAFITVGVALIRALRVRDPHLLPYFLILGGGFSNVWDRVRYGAVIDYLIVPNVGLYFNIADVMIIGGIVFFIWQQKSYPSQS